jgi:cell division protein FtsZ
MDEDSTLIDSKININDIEVSYDEINLDFVKEEEIEIEDVTVKINEFEVKDPELLEPVDQVSLDFDMPIAKNKDYSDKIVHELIEDVNEIIVNDPIEIIPVNEVDGSEITKSGIDDYSKLKEINESSDLKENKRVINPMNSSIAEGLAKRTEDRKIKLKEYNYNFNKAKRISEMEKEPAFKRAGVNLEDAELVKASRTSVSEDTNGEINLRTNNSFLHDNVD